MKLITVLLFIVQISIFPQIDFLKELNKKSFLVSKDEILSLISKTSEMKIDSSTRDFFQISNFNYRGIQFEKFTAGFSDDTLTHFNISTLDTVDSNKKFEILKDILVNTFGEAR